MRKARVLRQLQVVQLAERSKITGRHLESCESGRMSLSVDELIRVAEVLRLPLVHFLGDCMLCATPD